MNSFVKTDDAPAPESRPWKVLLVDDHPVVRDGLAQRIALEPDLSVCAACESVSRALREVTVHHPDLAVVDLSLPSGHGLDLIKEIHARYPEVRLLVFSMHDEQTYGERALLSGAQGYVMKDESPDEVLAAIRKVLSGRISISAHLSARLAEAAASTRGTRARKLPMDRLSNRELEVLEWMGQGKSVKAIAQRLERSAKTIETYRQRLKEKLNIESNSELIAHAARWVQEHSSHAATASQRKPRARKAKG
ncbi:two component transcriptional regulator, LuxR family [Chthoniobacter flavus Ellin428]|uniref:Two component transcriptional regulator, LuxR family n=1 Tax=Chthoniobacter flavus Ellin428 TaxID=497964 RepID=B4DA09_9BACT|nr:response regulator transcription factor [Chthoniobacter flavus]EDY16636.1 two component transcriptional regulator, LuxR family [Chthoniobacter flavus Ellin428]TCO87212.1 LuxR family two component transcriptional regulator [Chthoniobacter flavus]